MIRYEVVYPEKTKGAVSKAALESFQYCFSPLRGMAQTSLSSHTA